MDDKSTRMKCDLCKIIVQKCNFKQHTTGRKHKRNLKISQKKQALKKTVIVNVECEPSDLTKTNIVNVESVPSDLNKTDIIEVESESSDSNETDIHNVECEQSKSLNSKPNKRRRERRARKRKFVALVEQPEVETSEIQPEVFISVKGICKETSREDILQYFSKFGSIKMAYVGGDCMTIQYEHSHEAEKVTDMEHIINDKKFAVVQRKKKFFSKLSWKELCESQMLRQIQNIPVLDMQIIRFIECVAPDLNHMINIYHKIKCDVAAVMNPYFPFCMVYGFGSATTSLQFRGSNIDLFVDTENYEDCLPRASEALAKSPLFKVPFMVHQDGMEFVGCKHVEMDIVCFINFHNVLVVRNSELIRYYTSLDVKVRPFILVIKHWAEMHGLTRRKLFSNYSLVWMCIFYLQQTHSFPSVRLLQQGTFPTNPRTIWNMNFSQAAMITPGRGLNTSVRSLLQGFFAFYANFNYDSHFISPYMGEPIQRTLFLNESTIPEDFHLYKLNLFYMKLLPSNTPICLQDPLAHNVNTCKDIRYSLLKNYVELCGMALSKMLQNDETNMLYELFSGSEKIVKNSFYVCISKNFSNGSSPEEIDLKHLWFQRFKYFLDSVFEKIFKFNMTMESNAETATLYRAICSKDLWSDREEQAKNFTDKLERCRTILAREILVTDFMWSSSTTEISSLLFECDIHVSLHENPLRAIVRFNLINRDNSEIENFYSFLKLFKFKLGPWFEIYERELDEIY